MKGSRIKTPFQTVLHGIVIGTLLLFCLTGTAALGAQAADSLSVEVKDEGMSSVNKPAAEEVEGDAVSQQKTVDLATQPPIPHKNKGESLINQARLALKTQELTTAEELLLESLKYKLTDEQKRDVLLELALLYERMGVTSKMAMVYERFLKTFPSDANRPQIYIRLGRLYREMGAYDMAIDRFYNVINMSLGIDSDQMKLYQYLTMKAQLEIADTYFVTGDYEKAIKLFSRLQLMDLSQKERERVKFKTAYAHYFLENYPAVMNELEVFLSEYPNSPLAAEAHFILANTYKALNRTGSAIKEVMVLLRYDEMSNEEDKATWMYWKKRTANQLANDFYEQGDYMSALKIYQAMAPLNADPEWQWPIIYQIGLCFEKLRMLPKAEQAYSLIADKSQWKNTNFKMTETLKAIYETAAWRLEHLRWQLKTETQLETIIRPPDAA